MHNAINQESVTIGKIPFSREELISSLEEFSILYEKRPIEDNSGGMKAPQMFPTWFMTKWLQPKYIIESGVWLGQGTWLFEQAAPNAEIFCIEPNQHRIQYRVERAKYTTSDFSQFNWEDILDPKETLAFFDDHQDALERIILGEKQGFKHFMFEDNYPPGQGDCVSLKTMMEGSELDSSVIHGKLDMYYEFPPVIQPELTRWGDNWRENYRTNHPLIENEATYSCYEEGADNYTWICYARLKDGLTGSFS